MDNSLQAWKEPASSAAPPTLPVYQGAIWTAKNETTEQSSALPVHQRADGDALLC